MLYDSKIWVGTGEDYQPALLLPQMANRHGLIAGATGKRFVPENGFETGVFYCKITNTLINGTSAVTYSPLFLIVDTN